MPMTKEKKPPKAPQTKSIKQLKPDDIEIWEKSVRDVKRLKNHGIKETTTPAPKAIKTRPVAQSHHSGIITLETLKPLLTHNPVSQSSFQMDSNQKRRFAAGDIPFDGKIDLHGLTQHQAHSHFLDFILNHITNQARCLLVITGKGDPTGQSGRGIIRQQFHRWCDDSRLKPHILAINQAHIRHGGQGAFYILLRKKRDK